MPLLTAVLIGYVVALKVALAVAGQRWYQWRRLANAYRAQFDNVQTAWNADQSRIRESEAVLVDNVRLRDALALVRGLVQRRPPRRRWLALARRVAGVTLGVARQGDYEN